MADTSNDACNGKIQRVPIYLPRFVKPRHPNNIASATPKTKPSTHPTIDTLLPGICMPFIRDDCVEMERCIQLHELPAVEEFYERLCTYTGDKVAKFFFAVIVRCPKLMRLYFGTFLDYFAMHWQRDDLIETIGIFERAADEKMRAEQCQYVVLSFMRTGMSYDATMLTIFDHLANKSMASINFVLKASIVDVTAIGGSGGLPRILDTLVRRKTTIEPDTINRLMKIFLETNNRALDKSIFNVMKVQQWVAKQLDRELLEQFKNSFAPPTPRNGTKKS